MIVTYVFIDGEKIRTNDDLHAAFKAAIPLPDWYGNNLDALHDVLTDLPAPVGVIAVNLTQLQKHLGRRCGGFLRLMRELNAREVIRFCPFAFDEIEKEAD